MATKPKYPWDQIAREYILGSDEVTYRYLSRKYGCHPVTMANRARQGSWMEQRLTYRDKTTAKVIEKAAEEESDWQARHLRAAKGLMDKALLALEALDPRMLDPQEIRLFITAACSIEHAIMTIGGGDPEVANIDHEERVERLLELLKARGVAAD